MGWSDGIQKLFNVAKDEAIDLISTPATPGAFLFEELDSMISVHDGFASTTAKSVDESYKLLDSALDNKNTDWSTSKNDEDLEISCSWDPDYKKQFKHNN